MIDLIAIQPEIKACAKQVVALMIRSCDGAKDEADMQQNMGIIMGMLVQEIQHETEAIQDLTGPKKPTKPSEDA